MAVLPLNTFKTKTATLNTTPASIYTCPVGYTGIVLLAQIANISEGIASATFKHVHLTTKTPLIQLAPVPPNDALVVLSGRLVLEEGDSVEVSSDVPGALQIVMSLVESANS